MGLRSFLCSVFNCPTSTPAPSVEIVARLEVVGVNGAVNILGPDGRNYVLYYRNDSAWTPVVLVEDFPV